MSVPHPLALVLAALFGGGVVHILWHGVTMALRARRSAREIAALPWQEGWATLPPDLQSLLRNREQPRRTDWGLLGSALGLGVMAVYEYHRAFRGMPSGTGAVLSLPLLALFLLAAFGPWLVAHLIAAVSCRRITRRVREQSQRFRGEASGEGVWPPPPSRPAV